MSQQLEIAVTYVGYVRRSDTTGLFVSWCPLLDIKSQGVTQEQAKLALEDSIGLFLRHVELASPEKGEASRRFAWRPNQTSVVVEEST